MLKAIFKNRMMDFRPTFFIAMYLTLGLLVGYYIGVSNTAVIVLCTIALIMVFIDLTKNKQLILLILYFLSFAAGIALISAEMDIEPLPSQATTVTGRIIETKRYDDRTYYVLKDWQAASENNTISPHKNLRFVSKDNSLVFGDIVTFNANLAYPKAQRNIAGFNQRLYLLGKNIAYVAKGRVAGIVVTGNVKGLDSVFNQINTHIVNTVQQTFPVSSRGIAKGLILGDKSDITQDDYNAFKRGGIASILAVSGLHFGIISLFIFWLLSLVGIGRKPANIITGVFMLVYAGVVGFSVSATRALIMGLVIVIANLLGKKKDPLAFLSVAYIISLVIRPASLFSVGFMLSFGAVFTILMLNKPLTKLLKRLPKRLADFVTTPISATLGTAPFIINYFNYISLVGVLANIVVIPIGSLAVIFTLLTAVFGTILGVPFAWVADKLIWLMQSITQALVALPHAAVNVESLPTAFMVIWFVLIFIVSSICLFKPKIKAVVSVILIIVMVLLLIFVPLDNANNLQIYFFDVGQGDAIFIRTPENKYYMVDTGRAYQYAEIERFLLSYGYVLDGLFLTHADDDHIGGAEQMIENGLVKHLYLSYPQRNSYKIKAPIETTLLSKGDSVALSDTVSMTVLHPSFGDWGDSDNVLSLCMVLNYKEYRVLLTGDIDDSVEQTILPIVGDIDVLKVAHHGTKYASSPAFLNSIDAEIAVILTGENSYGHPAKQTLYNLVNACDIIYRTDLEGGIMLTFADEITATSVIKQPMEMNFR